MKSFSMLGLVVLLGCGSSKGREVDTDTDTGSETGIVVDTGTGGADTGSVGQEGTDTAVDTGSGTADSVGDTGTASEGTETASEGTGMPDTGTGTRGADTGTGEPVETDTGTVGDVETGSWVDTGSCQETDTGTVGDTSTETNIGCPDITIHHPDDLAGLAGLRCVRNIRVSQTALTRVYLPNLVVVQGQLSIEYNPILANLELSSLVEIGELYVVHNPELSTCDLWSELAGIVAGGIEISDNLADGWPDHCGDTETASEPDSDTEIDAGVDTSDWVPVDTDGCAGGGQAIIIKGDDGLDLIRGARCASADLFIRSTGIANLNLPRLEEVRGNLDIRDCANLTNINLPKLTQIGGWLSVSSNPKLPTCIAKDLVWQVPNLSTWGIADNACDVCADPYRCVMHDGGIN